MESTMNIKRFDTQPIGCTIAVAALTALLLSGSSAQAGTPGNLFAPAPLKAVPLPEPASLTNFVKDRKAAINLGKALFWDMQVGSDGVQACATCHFHSGADHRTKNNVNPGQAGGDNSFQLVPGPNATVVSGNFPFHKLSNPDDRKSVVSDVNDVMGSQGVFFTQFLGINREKSSES